MQFVTAIPTYGVWHYTKAYRDLWRNFRVFMKFLVRFFSIGLLFKTLFSPWERMSESYKKGLDPGAFFSTLIVNTITRLFGFVVRFSTIVVGLVTMFSGLVLGLVIFVFWTIMPIGIVLLLGSGLGTLFF